MKVNKIKNGFYELEKDGVKVEARKGDASNAWIKNWSVSLNGERLFTAGTLKKAKASFEYFVNEKKENL